MVRAAVAECAASADRGVDLRGVREAFVGSLGFGGGQLGNMAALMNDQAGLRKRYWLGVSGEPEWERMAGLTFPGVYAMIASRHMHEFGTRAEDLAAVAVKNHAYGALNPQAQFRRAISVEEALKAPMVASPLTLYDCCGTT